MKNVFQRRNNMLNYNTINHTWNSNCWTTCICTRHCAVLLSSRVCSLFKCLQRSNTDKQFGGGVAENKWNLIGVCWLHYTSSDVENLTQNKTNSSNNYKRCTSITRHVSLDLTTYENTHHTSSGDVQSFSTHLRNAWKSPKTVSQPGHLHMPFPYSGWLFSSSEPLQQIQETSTNDFTINMLVTQACSNEASTGRDTCEMLWLHLWSTFPSSSGLTDDCCW